MKGEYRDDKNNPHSSTTMFSKFNHHHQHQPPQQTPPPPPSQHFAITSHQFSNTSEEADSRNNHSSPNNLAITPTKDMHTNINDGASIEVVRRPRGRPPGSKNKPKPPVIITREPDPSMSPYVLELPGGTDIVDAVVRYCRKRNMGLCVLTGSGTVANVSLRQPSTTAAAAATVTFHGRFDILSISATVLPSITESASATPFANGFTISLAGPQGQIVGGAVAGPLMSGGPVYIIAASFNNPMYHRLSSDEDGAGGGTGSAAASEQSLPAERSAGGDSGGGHYHPPQTTAADTISMYSSHLPSDVIWAPTARQGPLHPPRY